jgi:hypothetical protein
LIQPAEEKIFSLVYGQFEAPKKRENSQKTAPRTPKTEKNYTPETPKTTIKSTRWD